MTRCNPGGGRGRRPCRRWCHAPLCKPGARPVNPENDDQKVGIDIVRRALHAQAKQIFANAGEDGSIIVGKLLEKGQANHGFDAQTGHYVDMVKVGIIDPTKVVRLALQGAASIAGLLVTTEAMVAEKPQKRTPSMPYGGMENGGFEVDCLLQSLTSPRRARPSVGLRPARGSEPSIDIPASPSCC
jgi:TCP-1/cpn60 chaperonin family